MTLRLAYASPLPPQRSGIAHYSAELLPRLARSAEIDLFVAAGLKPEWEGSGAFAVRPLASLGERLARGDYDAAVYQLGNDARYHGEIYSTLLRHPGVVVLHEYMLQHLVRELTLVRGDVDAYLEEHRYCHGASGLALARRAVGSGLPFDIWSYPLFERVVDRSLGLIVHGEHTRRRVLASRPEARVEVIPHPLELAALPAPEEGRAARRRWGLAEDALVVGSFGFVTPAKRLEVALSAFARLRRRHPRAVYLLAGGVSPYYDLDRLVGEELRGAVVATGSLDRRELLSAMAAADIAVNLRHPTGGETSGACVALLGLGKPVIVTDAGWFAEIPDDCCAKVPLDEHEEDVLAAFLEALAADPGLRRRLGDNARRHAADRHAVEGAAEEYLSFVRRVVQQAPLPAPAVPPLAPYPPEDVFTHLVADTAAAAADLGLGAGGLGEAGPGEDDDELLAGLAAALADLDPERSGGPS